jgi:8-amino-7-oxononanoate synthase
MEYLINGARPFIYSTAPPPYVAAAVRHALRLVDEEPWRRDRLRQLASFAGRRLGEALGGATARGGTQIIPVILGEERRAIAAAEALRRKGFDVRAIRPPTVPAGTSRLRVSIGVDRTEAEIEALGVALQGALIAAVG